MMNHGVTGRWGGGLVVVAALAAALTGCAAEPPAAAEATSEATAEATATPAEAGEVTALSSAPDAAGRRTWWIFRGGRGDAVLATDLSEALRAARIVDVHPRDVKVSAEQAGEAGGGYVTASVGLGGGGR